MSIIAVSVGSGCVSYEPAPLVGHTLIAEISQRRLQPDPTTATEPTPALAFAQAAAWMSEYNPDLRELRATYDQQSALAAVATPWPNPSVNAGLAHGFRLEDAVAGRTQPFIGMGFAIPLGPRLAATDDLHAARAEAARVDLVASHRELYLSLRHSFVRYSLATRRLAAQRELVNDTTRILAIIEDQAAQGIGAALDVGVMRLELGQATLELFDYEQAVDEIRSELAALMGVAASRFADLDVQSITPAGIVPYPAIDDLPGILATHHLALSRLEAAYEVAERQLRLEVARQYPDLELGWDGGQDVGEKSRELSLSVGIAIPLFDRNQQGIAEANAARQSARVAYESEAARVLAAADRLYQQRTRLEARLRATRDLMQTQAQANVANGQRLMQAGRLDAVRFVELVRTERELHVATLEIQNQLVENQLQLEYLLCLPLHTLPGIPSFDSALTPSPSATSGDSTR